MRRDSAYGKRPERAEPNIPSRCGFRMHAAVALSVTSQRRRRAEAGRPIDADVPSRRRAPEVDGQWSLGHSRHPESEIPGARACQGQSPGQLRLDRRQDVGTAHGAGDGRPERASSGVLAPRRSTNPGRRREGPAPHHGAPHSMPGTPRVSGRRRAGPWRRRPRATDGDRGSGAVMTQSMRDMESVDCPPANRNPNILLKKPRATPFPHAAPGVARSSIHSRSRAADWAGRDNRRTGRARWQPQPPQPKAVVRAAASVASGMGRRAVAMAK